MTGLNIRPPDVEGVFVRRINRFMGVAVINGEESLIHIHDPGRLGELLRPGIRVYAYVKSEGKARYYLTAVRAGDELVLVNSAIHNHVASWLIDNGLLLKGYRVVRREPRFLDGRFDLLLRRMDGVEAMVEVKGVTLEVNGVAKFPDAPTSRGARHMARLIDALRAGFEAHVVFLVFRRGARVLRPNAELDPRFANALKKAVERGVKAWAYRLTLGDDWMLKPEGELPVELP
jgi:sugar fermentation stimulation protein A